MLVCTPLSLTSVLIVPNAAAAPQAVLTLLGFTAAGVKAGTFPFSPPTSTAGPRAFAQSAGAAGISGWFMGMLGSAGCGTMELARVDTSGLRCLCNATCLFAGGMLSYSVCDGEGLVPTLYFYTP
ncbi:uncharacterized protein LOC62_03G003726 [Vanrija pseudolonga]|uniref:Secreted protein n=1 Tax=Vanrija pseudolonga TaxID=143232 RepID=A0AAF0Y519_9TREE|nr:hypothetical protein LOC62_03G003726 [Vanrija pseudolonga]